MHTSSPGRNGTVRRSRPLEPTAADGSAFVRRGEIRFADLEPVRGSDAKARPVVIMSNDGATCGLPLLGTAVVTLSRDTNVARILPYRRCSTRHDRIGTLVQSPG